MQKRQIYYLKSLLFSILFLSLETTTLFATPKYNHAIGWARNGELDKSLNFLSTLHKENPKDKKLLYDYITVLGWAKKDAQAIRVANSVSFSTAPAYAIQNIAKSARNVKKYRLAVKLYVLGAKRFPNNSDFYLGLALSLNDMKRFKLSNRIFNKAKQKFPNNVNLKFTQAEIYEYNKNFFDAMAIYQELLPNPKIHDKAVIRLVGTLRKLGMPFAAQKYIQANPKLFDDEARSGIQSDQATFKLRWGIKGYHKENDNTDVKEAIDKIDTVIRTLKS